MRHPHKEHWERVIEIFEPNWLQTDADDFRWIKLPPSCTALPVYRDSNAPADSDLPDRLLFEGTHSGSGRVADWDEASGLAHVAEVILAGGLTVDNVADAVSFVRPWGVDVSSGVERARGEKDPDKIKEFVARVRAIEDVSMETKEREALLAALLDGRLPDKNGRFGPFGGRYVPETLMPAIERLTHGVEHVLPSAEFQTALARELKSWIGRPTALTAAPTLSTALGRRRLAEARGLGAHGRAQDQQRHRPGAARESARRQARRRRDGRGPARRRVGRGLRARRPAVHRLHGRDRRRAASAERRPHAPVRRDRRRREIRRPHAARRDRRGDSRLGIGSRSARTTCSARRSARIRIRISCGSCKPSSAAKRAPRCSPKRAACPTPCSRASAAARTRSGSSTASSPIAASRSSASRPAAEAPALGEHSATLSYGKPGVLHGTHTMLLYDKHGQIQETHSISAGLDYPGVGPEHALLQAIGRVEYVTASDDETLAALEELRGRRNLAGARELACARRREALGGEEPRAARVLIGALRPRRQGHADSRAIPAAVPKARAACSRVTAFAPRCARDLAKRGRPALVAYITAGYPGAARVPRRAARRRSACDAVEIGVPFSDPMADGVTIQRSSQHAIEHGVSLTWIFDELARRDFELTAPVLLMSYLNPLLAFGFDALARARGRGRGRRLHRARPPVRGERAVRSGARAARPRTRADGYARNPRRAREALCAASQGFVYAVTRTGVTGDVALPPETAQYLAAVKAVSPLPVCAGFGVRRAEQVALIGAHADGVIVGSALVEVLERGEDPAAFLRSLYT